MDHVVICWVKIRDMWWWISENLLPLWFMLLRWVEEQASSSEKNGECWHVSTPTLKSMKEVVYVQKLGEWKYTRVECEAESCLYWLRVLTISRFCLRKSSIRDYLNGVATIRSDDCHLSMLDSVASKWVQWWYSI